MIARSRTQVLIIAVVLGLAAAGLAQYYMTTVSQAATVKERVVVAKSAIPARTVVTEDMLSFKEVPKGARHPEAASSMAPFIGKVTKQSIIPGEQVLPTKFFRDRQESGLAYVIPPGRRAVAVSVDEHKGAGGLIAAGDKVDVIGVCNVSAADNRVTLTKTIFALQAIEVLAVAQKVVGEEAAQPLDAVRANSSSLSVARQPSQQATAKTLTMALTPGEAQSVISLEANGDCSIRLALRSPEDTEQPKLPEAVFNPVQPLADQVKR
jgi:pilus assembly protein CpaB